MGDRLTMDDRITQVPPQETNRLDIRIESEDGALLRITRIPHNFVLQRYNGMITPKKPDKNGVIPPPYHSWTDLGAYGDRLESAILAVRKYRIAQSKAQTLEELADDIRKATEEVRELARVYL